MYRCIISSSNSRLQGPSRIHISSNNTIDKILESAFIFSIKNVLHVNIMKLSDISNKIRCCAHVTAVNYSCYSWLVGLCSHGPGLSRVAFYIDSSKTARCALSYYALHRATYTRCQTLYAPHAWLSVYIAYANACTRISSIVFFQQEV